jgi:hypothetical protein
MARAEFFGLRQSHVPILPMTRLVPRAGSGRHEMTVEPGRHAETRNAPVAAMEMQADLHT